MSEALRVLYVGADSADADGRAARLAAERPSIDVTTSAAAESPSAADYDCLIVDAPADAPGVVSSLREADPTLPVVVAADSAADTRVPGRGTTIRVSVGEQTDAAGTLADAVAAAADAPGETPASLVPGRGRPAPRRFLERALDELEDIFFVFGPDGRLREWNDRLPAVTGYSDDELASMSGVALAPEAERDRIQSEFPAALTAGDSMVETALETAAGDRVPVEVAAERLTDASGDLTGVVGIARDVSDRKERERELHEYRDYTSRILDAIDDIVFVHDTDGRLQRWNESFASVTGYDHDEIGSMHGTDFVPDDAVERTARRIETVFEDGSAHLETTIVTKDGDEIPYEFAANRVTGPDGEPRLVGVGRDVTERVKRERELERQNERLERVTNVVSHDLRNPLTVASAHLDLVRETGDEESIDAVERSLDRMQSLVEDVLALARGDHTVEDRESVSLAAAAEESWAQVPTGAGTLVTDGDRTVCADASRFKQLLENLVRNAVEHGSKSLDAGVGEDGDREGVTVTVGATEDGFYVADDGPGIQPGLRESIAAGEVSVTDGDTGFGLTVVTEVADAHGWDLSVTESESGGARFEFSGVETR